LANNFTGATAASTTFASQDATGVHYEKIKTSGATIANMAALAPTTSTSATSIAANPDRRSVALQNTGTVDVRIHKTSGFTLGTGWLLSPGQGFATDYTGAIFVAAATGTGAVNYWEDANG
jgi:hypothetical protein